MKSYVGDCKERKFNPNSITSDVTGSAMSPVYLTNIFNDSKDGHDDNKTMTDVQRQVDDVKAIVETNMTKMLGNTDQIDALAANSEELSDTSKKFLREAKKANKSCCRR